MKRHLIDRIASRVAGASSLLAAAVCVLGMFASVAVAQTMNNAFGGLSENSGEPIDIEADMLTVFDAKKYATFKGNVRAVQGTTTLRAAELHVHYVGGAAKFTGGASEAAAEPSSKPAGTGATADSQINKIEARGQVVITSEDDQTTTSDWAIYDVPAQLVTVGGNVVLSQGQNVLKGDRLVIDLETGESRFENTGTSTAGGSPGRIRALFMPKDDGKPGGDGDKKDAEGGAAVPPAMQTQGGAAVDNTPPARPVPELR